MLTIEQTDHNLKITWSLRKPIASDLTEFEKMNIPDKNSLTEEALIIITGEEEIPTIIWRAFLSMVKTLLDQNIKLRFLCSNPKVKEALEFFGFSLLGTVEAIK